MNDQFTESELLAFVEDELDTATRRTLEARLAEDPGLRARLTAMHEDRIVLRGMPEPALPVDFIAALEPQLARPLLMQAPPGSYRRRHHRAARRSRQLRLAVAAGLLVAFGAGLWGSVSLVTGWTSGGTGDGIVRGPGRIAADPAVARGADTPGAGLASSDTQGRVDPAGPPPGLIVHHHAPLPGVARDTTVAAVSVDGGVDANATPIVSFAVVLSDDHASAEDRLVAALDGMDVGDGGDGGGMRSAALVRNFNMAEAGSLIRELQARGIRDAGTPEVFAGIDAGAPARKAGRKRLASVLRRLNRGAVPEVDARRRSGLLVGSDEVAPSYEDQLELSSRGATHTVTLRADQLATFVERLHPLRAGDARTTLRPLPDADAPAVETDALAAFGLVQAEMARLADAPPGTLVMLPVVIE